MRFLGKLRGEGTLVCDAATIGAATYEFDGYLIRPGEVAASGELRMPAADLNRAIGGREWLLHTAGGPVFRLRFTGKPSDAGRDAVHVDVTEGLPPVKQWRR
jgi:hypothetical protein